MAALRLFLGLRKFTSFLIKNEGTPFNDYIYLVHLIPMINQDTYYPPLLYSLIPDEIQVGLIKNEGNPSKLIRNEGTLPQYPPEHFRM